MHYESKVFTTYAQELEHRLNKVLADISDNDHELVDVKLTPIKKALCQILLIANFTVLEVRQLLMLFFYLVWCAFVVV
ncbi:hypothetical protein AYR54_02500 [Loigolactobacillus backii]|nr:hypothetical protein AYR52_02505 [Loigolactobacillus backii]ANK64231.1 hypothetical protein AYR54_02500 [Loigolactobacillus backii]PIO88106.1 hypothetical protein B8A32_03295 [Loigolactobacillus backii]